MLKNITVVAAVFMQNNQYFCARRKNEGELALKWEFPGGKVETGETHEDALKREIQEELSVEIQVNNHLITVNHQYNTFHITMHVYAAKIIGGSLKINAHSEVLWLDKQKLNTLDWAEADFPVIEYLMRK